jgi:hypothetical protein
MHSRIADDFYIPLNRVSHVTRIFNAYNRIGIGDTGKRAGKRRRRIAMSTFFTLVS